MGNASLERYAEARSAPEPGDRGLVLGVRHAFADSDAINLLSPFDSVPSNVAHTPASLLLIDDDRQLCSLMRDFLMQQGFAVAIAYDGLTGLAMASGGSHDLVLLDVVLPGLGGFSVLDELRRVSDVPVLMLTARGEPSDRVFGLSAGADDYLAKPFDPAELVARVHAILRRSPELARSRKMPVIDIAGVCLDAAARQVKRGRFAGRSHQRRVRHPGNSHAGGRASGIARRDFSTAQPTGSRGARSRRRCSCQPDSPQARLEGRADSDRARGRLSVCA